MSHRIQDIAINFWTLQFDLGFFCVLISLDACLRLAEMIVSITPIEKIGKNSSHSTAETSHWSKMVNGISHIYNV